MTGQRICATCKTEKSLVEFNKDSRKKLGVRYNCKVCERRRMGVYDASAAGQKRMRIGRWKAQGIAISYENYVEKYAQLEGRCQICNVHFPSLAVDHDHTTGKIRGLLCKKCNLGISSFKDSPEILSSAISYLEKSL